MKRKTQAIGISVAVSLLLAAQVHGMNISNTSATPTPPPPSAGSQPSTTQENASVSDTHPATEDNHQNVILQVNAPHAPADHETK